MRKEPKAGERVRWSSSGGEAVGRVVRKLTKSTRIKGHKVAASKENPEFLVESEKSGGRAAHRKEALRKP